MGPLTGLAMRSNLHGVNWHDFDAAPCLGSGRGVAPPTAELHMRAWQQPLAVDDSSAGAGIRRQASRQKVTTSTTSVDGKPLPWRTASRASWLRDAFSWPGAIIRADNPQVETVLWARAVIQERRIFFAVSHWGDREASDPRTPGSIAQLLDHLAERGTKGRAVVTSSRNAPASSAGGRRPRDHDLGAVVDGNVAAAGPEGQAVRRRTFVRRRGPTRRGPSQSLRRGLRKMQSPEPRPGHAGWLRPGSMSGSTVAAAAAKRLTDSAAWISRASRR